MKFSSVALLAFMAVERVHPAYSFQTPINNAGPRRGIRSLAVDMTAETDVGSSDVSIPYNAAAELAYDGWIAKFDKPYDAERYKVFFSNYKAITVMNISAKKAARDDPDSGSPSLLSLNEYADYTAEEYSAAMKGDSDTSTDDSSSDAGEEQPTTGNILGDAVKNVQSQASASSALQEAADALEAEEEKLAAQLGLDSVEELEDAMDFLEGIDSEGVEMDDGDLAREARVRSAYMDWCKDFDKESDETRFKQFFNNFLEMEDFSIETGKEMILNEFADFTEAEYVAMQNGETPVVEEKKETEVEAVAEVAETIEEDTPVEVEAEEDAAIKAEADEKAAEDAANAEADEKAAEVAAAKAAAEEKAAEEAAAIEDNAAQEAAAKVAAEEKAAQEAAAKVAAEKKAAEDAAAKAIAEKQAAIQAEKDAAAKAIADKKAAIKAERDAKIQAEEDRKAKIRAEAARLAAMTEDERRAEITKGIAARQSAQAKEIEKAAAAREAEVIAANLEATKKEASRIAKARAIQDEAGEIARAKALEWEEMQAKISEGKQTVARLPTPPPAVPRSVAATPKVETPVVETKSEGFQTQTNAESCFFLRHSRKGKTKTSCSQGRGRYSRTKGSTTQTGSSPANSREACEASTNL